MAVSKTGGRAAAVIMVEWDPVGAAGVYTNWAGAKNFSLSVDNEIQGHKLGDDDDWSLPVITQKEYAGQDIKASMDATWTAASHVKTSDWALSQKKLLVRVNFPSAIIGEIEFYDGTAMIGSLSLGDIGNLDGGLITETVSMEFDGTITATVKAV